MRRSRSQLNKVSQHAGNAFGGQDPMHGYAQSHEANEIQRRLNAMNSQFGVHQPYYDDPIQANNMPPMMHHQAYQQPFPNAQMMQQPPMPAPVPAPAAPHYQQPAQAYPQATAPMPSMVGESYQGAIVNPSKGSEANTQQIDTIKNALEQMSNKLHAINNNNAARSTSETTSMQQVEAVKQNQALILQSLNDLKDAFANTPATHDTSNDLEIIRETLNANYRAIMEHLESAPQNTIDTTVLNNAVEASHNEISSQLGELKNSIETTLINPDIYAKTLEVSHDDITKRLDDMNNALQTTIAQPDLYLETAENNNRALAEQITQLQNSIGEMDTSASSATEIDLSSIEMRLEEITRAVVALSLNDNSVNNLERIEARVSDLTKTLNEFSSPEAVDTQAIEKLENKLNDIASLMSAGSPGVTDLAAEVHSLSEKFENLSVLSISGSENPANDGALLKRMDALVEQISASQKSEVSANSNADVLKQLETLTSAIDQLAEPAALDDSHEKFLSIEQQLSAISQQLDQDPATGAISFDPLFDRLSGIEEQIGSSRDITIEIATKAAEEAVKMSMQAGGQVASSGNDINPAVLGSMSEALEVLNKHTKESNSQNIEAFGAVSETLNMMVDRLGKIEAGFAKTAHTPMQSSGFVASEMPVASKQEPDAAYEAPLQEDYQELEPSNAFNDQNARKNPVEDLVRNAKRERDMNVAPAPMDNELVIDNVVHETAAMVVEQPAIQENIMPQADAPSIAMDAMPEVREAELQLNAKDTAIEPGMGGPDLAALVQQANERRKNQKGTDSDSGGTDFIAAARRAAQAAAQEAGEIEEKIEEKQSKNLLSSLPELFAKRKKAILMGAAAVLFAAIALPLVGKMFGGSDAQVAEVATPPAIEQVDTAPQPSLTANAPVAAVNPVPSNNNNQAATTQGDVTGQDASSALVAPEANLNVASLNTDENPTPTSFINVEGLDFVNDALREAVRLGEPAALFEVGKRYTDGIGVEKDLAKAAEWYERAAEKGFAPAQYIVGNFNEKGFGVEKNAAEAAKWYEEAARGGNIIAMHNLAVLTATPNAISEQPDMTQAFKWFVNAADYGVRDSQVNAGIFYTKGFGTEVDLIEAYKWFAVAAKAGDKDAANKREVIANAMPPSDLEIAKALVNDWKPLDVVKAANEVDANEAWKSASQPVAALKIDRNMIAQTQVLLKRAGFDAGTPDGIMGQNTTNAIIGFQQKVGLPANGKIDIELLRALQSFGA